MEKRAIKVAAEEIKKEASDNSDNAGGDGEADERKSDGKFIICPPFSHT